MNMLTLQINKPELLQTRVCQSVSLESQIVNILLMQATYALDYTFLSIINSLLKIKTTQPLAHTKSGPQARFELWTRVFWAMDLTAPLNQ